MPTPTVVFTDIEDYGMTLVSRNRNLLNPATVVAGHTYFGHPAENTAYSYTDLIPVSEGQKLYLQRDWKSWDTVSPVNGRINAGFRYVVAYNNNKQNIGEYGNQNLFSPYIVPEGVSYVRITAYTSDIRSDYNSVILASETGDVEGYIPYQTKFSLSVSENLYENARVDREALESVWESGVITRIIANDENTNQEKYSFNISDDMIEEFDAPTNSITYKYDFRESYYTYSIGNGKTAYYYPRRLYAYAFSSYSTDDTLYFPNPIKSSLENSTEYKVIETIEKYEIDNYFGRVLIGQDEQGQNIYAYAGVGGEMADYIDGIQYINFASYVGDNDFQKYSSLWYAFRNGDTILSAKAFWDLYNDKVQSCGQISEKGNFTNKIYCDTFHKRNFYGGFLAKDIVIKNNGSELFYKTPYYGGMKVDASGDGVITINPDTTTFKAGRLISDVYETLLTAIMTGIEGKNITVNGLSGANLANFKISVVSTSYGFKNGNNNIEDDQTGYIWAKDGDPFWAVYWGPFRCRGYLREVHIPEGYHNIGPGAFYMTKIEKLFLPRVNKKNAQGRWKVSLSVDKQASIDTYYLEDVYINNNHTDFPDSAPLSSFFTPKNGTIHFLDGSITYKNGTSQGFKTTGAYQYVNKT